MLIYTYNAIFTTAIFYSLEGKNKKKCTIKSILKWTYIDCHNIGSLYIYAVFLILRIGFLQKLSCLKKFAN